MEGKPMSACEMAGLETQRQNFIMENMTQMFDELNPENRYKLLDHLLRNEAIRDQKFMRLCFDNIIEPCPICGSHDLYLKVKQEYRDMQRHVWNPEFNVPKIEHFKMPVTARGTFMCGKCKSKFWVLADRVPELYKKWNYYASHNRRW